MKRLMIKLGCHGRAHTRARIQRDLRSFARSQMAAYWFDQGEHGPSMNQAGRLL